MLYHTGSLVTTFILPEVDNSSGAAGVEPCFFIHLKYSKVICAQKTSKKCQHYPTVGFVHWQDMAGLENLEMKHHNGDIQPTKLSWRKNCCEALHSNFYVGGIDLYVISLTITVRYCKYMICVLYACRSAYVNYVRTYQLITC